ncbi:MAG: ABC transporter substrate-binding protein [Actinomycetota bacterium]
MPLTGPTSADEAFAPVKDGWLAYMQYANEQGLLGNLKIVASIEDDQYDPTQTPGAVSKQLGAGVQVFSGILGSPNNLAVRDTLNQECIPQLNNLTGLPAWGTDVKDFPWTTGERVPYTVETRVYMQSLKENFPSGVKVGLFYVKTDFGQTYADTLKAEGKSYGITVVSEQTVAPDGAPPVDQVTSLAAAKPDAIVAVPLGAGCITFLKALADKKAQTPGWDPKVYVTNTCASALILAVAGATADGILTSANYLDVSDPVNANNTSVKAYLAYMAKLGKSDSVTTATAGWAVAEYTVAIIKHAQDMGPLTRASIIDAARNMVYTPTLARAGVVFKMNGTTDPFVAESLQVVKWNATTKLFTDIGKLITQFES